VIHRKELQLLFKILELRTGKRSIYKPNFTSSEGNLLRGKREWGFLSSD
jgi:hypothetical protein